MAASTPYGQLVGPVKVYVAPAGTAEPTVSSTPGGSWTELGATADDQTIGSDAPNTYFYDNDHQGPVKAVTPQEDPKATFNLVNLTHAHVARILHDVANITTSAGPPAISQVPIKSGYIPGEYAILLKGLADSPFGNYPAQTWLPRGVFEKTWELTRGKTTRAGIACEFRVLEDDSQTEGLKLGRMTAQTS